MSDVLTTILVLIECISTFFCVGLTVVDGGCDRISFSGCFTCQIDIWVSTDDLTIAGRVILICLATPFILPCNVLFLFSYILLSIGVSFWKIYKRIFRKNERRDDP